MHRLLIYYYIFVVFCILSLIFYTSFSFYSFLVHHYIFLLFIIIIIRPSFCIFLVFARCYFVICFLVLFLILLPISFYSLMPPPPPHPSPFPSPRPCPPHPHLPNPPNPDHPSCSLTSHAHLPSIACLYLHLQPIPFFCMAYLKLVFIPLHCNSSLVLFLSRCTHARLTALNARYTHSIGSVRIICACK